jgi:UPF0716 protein FxsA
MILLFLFLVVPLAEIATFIWVGERIGLWPTLASVILTAVVGTALLRRQGFAVLRRVGHSLQRNRLPVAEVFHGACLLCAGALLLTPGFLTDAVGFAMFVPAVRRRLGRALFARLMGSTKVRVWARGATDPGEGDAADVIDADFVDLDADRPRNDGSGRRGNGS